MALWHGWMMAPLATGLASDLVRLGTRQPAFRQASFMVTGASQQGRVLYFYVRFTAAAVRKGKE